MRWRLTASHYLNVPGTEWEYRETDRNTGKQARRVFPVPTLLNPDDPGDCNYPGEIIVASAESKEYPRDLIFLGDPTPDMEPLDDEAQAKSDELRHKWQHPIETLPSTMSPQEESFMKMIMQAAGAKAAPGVDPAAFEALQAQVKALMDENAKLRSEPTARRA